MSEEIQVTETRKSDHIELAFKSQVADADQRFYYEPVLAAHPDQPLAPFSFGKKQLSAPIWISSMTGGTEKAGHINKSLARACAEFGIGMGLGSCRIILDDQSFFEDFNLRPIIGDGLPFYANLGVAQLEELITANRTDKVQRLVESLRADGLIIHVNPMQEWLQPEGDRFRMSPLRVIEHMLGVADYPIIVKEVGQGMGYHSLRELFRLPLAAIDFAAFGGTNFAKLELLRSKPENQELFGPLAHIGHTAAEMVDFTNSIVDELGSERKCNLVIISGGVSNFLDGYYLINKIKIPAVYGQASPFLKHALESYDQLHAFVKGQIEGLKIANAMLKVR